MNINTINPLVLAYIGDAIYELEIRKRLINKRLNKVNDLQQEAVKYVSAKSQADYINKLIDNNILTDEELDIYKRGRNAKVNSHPNSVPIVVYKMATGLEAVFGYLYLNNNIDRITELLTYLEV